MRPSTGRASRLSRSRASRACRSPWGRTTTCSRCSTGGCREARPCTSSIVRSSTRAARSTPAIPTSTCASSPSRAPRSRRAGASASRPGFCIATTGTRRSRRSSCARCGRASHCFARPARCSPSTTSATRASSPPSASRISGSRPLRGSCCTRAISPADGSTRCGTGSSTPTSSPRSVRLTRARSAPLSTAWGSRTACVPAAPPYRAS